MTTRMRKSVRTAKSIIRIIYRITYGTQDLRHFSAILGIRQSNDEGIEKSEQGDDDQIENQESHCQMKKRKRIQFIDLNRFGRVYQLPQKHT